MCSSIVHLPSFVGQQVLQRPMRCDGKNPGYRLPVQSFRVQRKSALAGCQISLESGNKPYGLWKRPCRKQRDAPLFPFWVEDRGLSFFLAFLVLITIFVPMVRLSRSWRIGMDLVFALMVFSGGIAPIRRRIFMYLIVALTVLEFSADLIVEFNPSLSHWGLGYGAQGIWPGYPGGHDAETHISSRPR